MEVKEVPLVESKKEDLSKEETLEKKQDQDSIGKIDNLTPALNNYKSYKSLITASQ